MEHQSYKVGENKPVLLLVPIILGATLYGAGVAVFSINHLIQMIF